MKNLVITTYIKNEKNRLKADGSAPVYFKLKANNTISYLPANVSVKPHRWEHTEKFTKRKMDLDEKKIAIYLNSQVKELNKIEDDFIEKNISYTAEMIKNRILGRDSTSLHKHKTVADAFKFHKDWFMDEVTKGEFKKDSYKKYRTVEFHLTQFVKKKYKQTIYPLANINDDFQDGFHLYLSSLPELSVKNTVIKYITLFRGVIRHAKEKKWLKEYPLTDYSMKRDKEIPISLILEEVQIIMKKDFKDEALKKTKDYFLFSVMTGLAYADVIDLEKKHIFLKNGDTIIIKRRVKTGIEAIILVQPEALDILEKYADKNEDNPEKCFPYYSNKELNK